MAKDNPFVLPGMGQSGESAQNPLFAGLEMMNQAWQSMANANQASQAPVMSLDDLDKRIRELRTVQNWLQLNSTMLANTIQGLEIQRSTLSMMKSFAGVAESESGDKASTGPDYSDTAKQWWDIMQQQFTELAKATNASLQTMADSAAESKPKTASKAAKTTKSTAKKTTKSSTKTTRK